MWNGLIWLRIGKSGGCCEHGNKPTVPKDAGNLLTEELFDYGEFCSMKLASPIKVL